MIFLPNTVAINREVIMANEALKVKNPNRLAPGNWYCFSKNSNK
jgi:hypothetical protein